MRRIAFVTTARSDYNITYPLMRAALADPAIDARIFCAGMHLVPEFGDTWRSLEADGLHIDEKVDFLTAEDSKPALAKALGHGVGAFTEALVRQTPDIIVVCGDRVENLPLFVAATTLGIPLAHLCGGDITEGAFDNQIRHTMTKLSHLHFVAMSDHARRVVQMGEEPWRVTVTGIAALDIIRDIVPAPRAEVAARLGLTADRPWCLCIHHPQTLGAQDGVAQYRTLLDTLADGPEIPILIYPNIDPGFDPLIALLEAFQARRPDAVLHRSLPREIFYATMHHAAFMAGNSSSGLWEAPSFGLPAINIGLRQAGRVRGANVIDTAGLDPAEMQAAFARARDPAFRASLAGMKNPYGDGQATALTLARLREVPIDTRLMMKLFHEIPFTPEALGEAAR